MREDRPTSTNTALFYALALGVAAVDQLTKFIARRTLSTDDPVTVIPELLDLRLSYNSGGAFGVMPNWAPLFIIVALVAVFAIVKLRQARSGSRGLAIGLGLMLGGAVGNLIDRIFAPGRAVTDFIDAHITTGGELHSWPTFNVADIGIVVGALFVFFYVYISSKRIDSADSE